MKHYTFNNILDFKCKNKDCKKSCCKLWQIKIDKKSLNKYSELAKSDERFNQNIDFNSATFKMTDNKTCKFLNKDGLCNLIIDYGEKALCQTCKTHPRFKSFFNGVIETGITLSCEEGARLILGAKDKLKLVDSKTKKTVSLTKEIKENTALTPFEKELLLYRRKALTIAQNRKIGIGERLSKLLILSNSILTKTPLNCWLKKLSSLSRLDSDSEEFFNALSNENIDYVCLKLNQNNMDVPLEQLLSYFLYRHIPNSFDYVDLFVNTSLSVLLFLGVLSGVRLGFDLQTSARIISSEIEYSNDNIHTLLTELETHVRFV